MWEPKQLIPYSRSDLRITRRADPIIMSSPFCSSRRSRTVNKQDQENDEPAQVHRPFDVASQMSLDISDVSHVSTLSDLSTLMRNKDAIFASLSTSNDSFPGIHKSEICKSPKAVPTNAKSSQISSTRLPHVEHWLLSHGDTEQRLFGTSKASSSSTSNLSNERHLKNRVKQLEECNFQLQRDKTNLQSQLNALKELKKAQGSTNMSASKTTMTRTEFTSVLEEKHRLEAEIDKKEEILNEFKKVRETQNKELERLRQAVGNREGLNNSDQQQSKKELSPHQQSSSANEMDLDSKLTEVVVSMPQSMRELTEGIEALMDDIGLKEQNLKQTQQSLKQLEDDFEALKQENEIILNEKTRLERDAKINLEAMKELIDSFKQHFEQNLNQIENRASQKTLKMEQKVKSIVDCLTHLKSAFEKQSKSIKQMQLEHQQELNELRKEIDKRPEVSKDEFMLVQSKLHQQVQLESENSELRSENEKLRESKQELSDRLLESEKLFTAEIENLAMDIKDREEMLNTMRMDIARVECDLSDTKRSLDSMSACKERIEEEQSSTLANLEHQTEDCTTLRKDLMEKKRLIQRTETQLTALVNENAHLETELETIRGKFALIECQLQQANRLLEDSESSHEEMSAVLQMQVNRLQGFLNECEQENEELKRDKMSLEGQILSLEEQNGQLVQRESVENEQMRETIERLQSDLEEDARLRQDLGASLEVAKRLLKQEVDEIRAQLETEKRERVELEQKYEELKAKNSDFEALREELEAMRIERDGYKHQMTEMNQALRSSLGHIKHLRSRGNTRSPSNCSSNESELDVNLDRGSTSLQQCLVSLKAEMLLLQTKLAPKYRAFKEEEE